MSQLDSCKLSKSLPLLLALLVFAQIDLASAFAWPVPLLTLLHLTAQTNDACRGVCAGLGTSLDVLVGFQLLRIFARRALAVDPDAHPGN
jgi:hypothetical protein